MEFLAILAATKVLRGATGLVNALKRPRVNKQDFTNILRQEVQKSLAPQAKPANEKDMLKQAGILTGKHISAHDKDGDGRLSLAESNVSGAQFAAWDSDGDGLLSSAELKPVFLASVKAAYTASAESK